jgi:hypothetical protein
MPEPQLPDFSLFTDEAQVTRKVKHRAGAILIQNPLGGPITVDYVQEIVPYEEDEPAGVPKTAGNIHYIFDTAVAASSFLINGKTITGAEVAEWLIRDYVTRRTAQLQGT